MGSRTSPSPSPLRNEVDDRMIEVFPEEGLEDLCEKDIVHEIGGVSKDAIRDQERQGLRHGAIDRG